MPKPTNKAILVTVAAAVLGAAAGSGVTYLAVHKQPSLADFARQGGPQNGDAPNFPVAKQDTSLPEGTVSPKALVMEPQKYTDKQVKVRGRIIQFGQDQYNIIGPETDNPVGLRADFSKSNVDPKTYSAPPLGTKVQGSKPPTLDTVTVTGTLQKKESSDGSLTYNFVVQSISK